MLRYTDSSLHKPLCRLEVASSDKKEQARLGKEVAGQFKNLLGWQGIKKASYPEQLAEEWLRYGAANPLMRAELYAQLMKQLSDAPGGQETQQACLGLGLAQLPLPLTLTRRRRSRRA